MDPIFGSVTQVTNPTTQDTSLSIEGVHELCYFKMMLTYKNEL